MPCVNIYIHLVYIISLHLNCCRMFFLFCFSVSTAVRIHLPGTMMWCHASNMYTSIFSRCLKHSVCVCVFVFGVPPRSSPGVRGWDRNSGRWRRQGQRWRHPGFRPRRRHGSIPAVFDQARRVAVGAGACTRYCSFFVLFFFLFTDVLLVFLF